LQICSYFLPVSTGHVVARMCIMNFTIKPTSLRFDLDSSDQIRHRTRGRGRVSRGQPRPTAVLKARGSSVPKFWTSYMRTHGTRNSIQVWHGDQTRCEKNFTGSTTPRPGKAFVTQMLTRDPFAVANLIVAITKSLKTPTIVNVLWKKCLTNVSLKLSRRLVSGSGSDDSIRDRYDSAADLSLVMQSSLPMPS